MRRLHVPRYIGTAQSVGGGAAVDSGAVSWAEAVIANGGTVSSARLNVVSQFIAAEKAAGTWAQTDDYWALWAENAPQALTSLKQRRLATAVAAPTFTPDRDYTFNGTTQYIDTGFVPTTHSTALTLSNARAAVYCRNNVTGGYAIGVGVGTNNIIAIRPRSTAVVMFAGASCGQAQYTVADAFGYSTTSRNGPLVADCIAYRNGAALTRTVDSAAVGVVVPNIPLSIGSLNLNSVQTFSTYAVGFAAIGASLTPAQEVAQYNNVQTFATAVGAALFSSTEAIAWRDQVVTNGGTVSDARLNIVDQFIRAEIAAGNWALTDDYWPLWGENEIQSLTSLKQRRLATVTAAPAFTINRGYTFDGATNYISSGFIAGTHGIAIGNDNIRYAAYERTELSSSAQTSMGGSSGSFFNQLITRQPTGVQVRLNTSAAILFTMPSATNLGYAAGSRNGIDVASVKAFKNGVELAFASGAPTFTSGRLPVAFNIGAFNGSGTPTAFRATSTGFVCVGAALASAQELAQYNNVQAWATAIGANV